MLSVIKYIHNLWWYKDQLNRSDNLILSVVIIIVASNTGLSIRQPEAIFRLSNTYFGARGGAFKCIGVQYTRE